MMKLADKISGACSRLGATLASGVKILLMSKPVAPALPVDASRELVVLGNGPSLLHTLDRHSSWLMHRDRLAVNFAANTPQFADLRPQHYVLADPHFFDGDGDPNVDRLWAALRDADWGMTLHVPSICRHRAEEALAGSGVRVKCFNATPVEGFSFLAHKAYSAGLGMPRPRNVLIPSIMTGIREGYGRIYLAGADHTWTQTLAVDEQNRVVTVQPHFYRDNDSEKERVSAVYADIHLHDMLRSLTVAFESYFRLRDYASGKGVEIINITPGSFIDAFPRQTPPSEG